MDRGEEYPLPQDEASATRWTSDKVLTVGVAQGWADPEDWRGIDFAQRPSCEGEYDFDNDGRPLNRHRTPDMPGDRGELGKWGINYASESLVVAVSDTGKRQILLVRRTDGERQWSLPGGMVDAGEQASAAAIREVWEEAGVDLRNVPSIILYQMYADDPRNTRNSWIETTGTVQVLQHTPEPQADGVETSAAAWFELPDTLEELEQVTGKLYASHGDGVRLLLAALRQFDDAVQEAQDLDATGRAPEARELRRMAALLLPGLLEGWPHIQDDAQGA